jgi:predicted nucleotidyltransferase
MSDICGCGIVIGLQTLKAGSVKQSETPQTMTRTIPSPAPKGFKMKEEILKKLKELKPSLYEKYGIENFAIFGSVAKGEENKDSDIDIAILKAKRKNLFLRLKAIRFLEEELDRKVDMGYFDSMKSFIKDKIKKDFVYV